MSKARSYSEKLKDPRWQKVRLLVLERAGWKCESCEAAEQTLHVHHGYYDRAKEPWEYPTDTLWCLCEDCHESAEHERRFFYSLLARCHPNSFDPSLALSLPERTSPLLKVSYLIANALEVSDHAARRPV